MDGMQNACHPCTVRQVDGPPAFSIAVRHNSGPQETILCEGMLLLQNHSPETASSPTFDTWQVGRKLKTHDEWLLELIESVATTQPCRARSESDASRHPIPCACAPRRSTTSLWADSAALVAYFLPTLQHSTRRHTHADRGQWTVDSAACSEGKIGATTS